MTPAAGDFIAQPLPPLRCVALKVGSSLLAGGSDHSNGSGLHARHAAGLACFIAESRTQGREVVQV